MVGKLVSIISHVRGNSSKHPWWRPTLHHLTYRAGAMVLRRKRSRHGRIPFCLASRKSLRIWNDIWIGHGAILLSGVGGPTGLLWVPVAWLQRAFPPGRSWWATPRAAPLLNILPLRKIWHGLVELVRCNVAGPLEDFSGTGGKIFASHCTLRPFLHVACAPTFMARISLDFPRICIRNVSS